jgi:hypothetical protein
MFVSWVCDCEILACAYSSDRQGRGDREGSNVQGHGSASVPMLLQQKSGFSLMTLRGFSLAYCGERTHRASMRSMPVDCRFNWHESILGLEVLLTPSMGQVNHWY